jgi:activator of Hsp90 ATPase-like protein
VSTTVTAPVVRAIEVNVSADRAFAVFTGGVATWWPTETHSIGKEQVELTAIEPYVGGRCFERWHDGTECSWGEVLVWEPPNRLTLAWHPSRDPDHPVTEVDVVFEANEAGTRVVLTHRGWEAYGSAADAERADYETGWPVVLARYVNAV